MKYIILLVSFIAEIAFAQTFTARSVIVSCDANKQAKAYANLDEANAAAKAMPCPVRTWIAANGYYTKSSSSSVSSVPTVAQITYNRPTSFNDGSELKLSDIDHYELKRLNRTEIIRSTGDNIVYVTTPPLQNEVFSIATVDKNGNYSDFVDIK